MHMDVPIATDSEKASVSTGFHSFPRVEYVSGSPLSKKGLEADQAYENLWRTLRDRCGLAVVQLHVDFFEGCSCRTVLAQCLLV